MRGEISPLIGPEMKICSKCKIEKLVSAFTKNKNNKDGFNYWCKDCSYKSARDWRIKNPEKSKASVNNWRIKNIEACRLYDRNRYANDIEGQKQRAKEYRSLNPDKIKETQKKYIKNNLPKLAEKNRRREASLLGATPSWLSEIQKIQIQWFYAAAKMMSDTSGVKHHVDHILPLRGKSSCGLHVPWNLQILPASENASKGNRISPA